MIFLLLLKIGLLWASASFFKAVMDTLQFWYADSVFVKWELRNDWLGAFARVWINPRYSWRNKNRPKNAILRKLTRTVLVGFTDLWHFAQLLYTLCLELSVIMLLPPIWGNFWDVVIYLIGLNLIQGISFELSVKALEQPQQQARGLIRNLISTRGILVANLGMIFFFLASYLVFIGFGGTPDVGFEHRATWAGGITALLGVVWAFGLAFISKLPPKNAPSEAA